MALRTGVQFSPYQQSFEVNVGTHTVNVNYQGANRKFAWIEVSLIYDRSDQHQIIDNSYNAELAATKMQLLKLENVSTTYSVTGGLVYDIDNEDHKPWLYSVFVAYSCYGCTTTPLTEYINNEIFQELPKERKYFNNIDEKLYIDMRRSKGYTDELERLTQDDSDLTLTLKLKTAATKKLRLRVIGYSQAEYYYILSNRGMIMSYKNYSISKKVDIAA